jgi:putative transposase
VVDFVTAFAAKTELSVINVVAWLGLAKGKFYSWKQRYGRVNEHNASVPRDHWIEEWERDEIIHFHGMYPLEGYRRLAFMMLDMTKVAVSPSTTYRVLRRANLLDRWNSKPSKKGTGFVQPLAPHKHWHIDIAYLNIAGTFYYLCSVLDGYSRAVVHWEIRESMTEADVETILQRAREKYPDARPRIISDNGPQFIARDFKAFIREAGMTHVRTSPYYPQSNGKIERWHKTLKTTTIRPKSPETMDEAIRVVREFVEHYNNVRLHSALGYVTPADKLAGREAVIFAERDRKLEAARERRQVRRRGLAQESASCAA